MPAPTFNLVSPNAAASAVFVEQEAVRRSVAAGVIPQKVLLLGQYNAGKTPTTSEPEKILNLAQARSRYGRGSMLARMAAKAFDTIGGVDLYAIAIEDDDAAVASTGSIDVAGTATSAGVLYLYVAGDRVRVGVASGDNANTVAEAIRAALVAAADLPVEAAIDTADLNTVELTAKWAGLSGNGITLAQSIQDGDADEAPDGITLTLNAMAGGAGDPEIAPALDSLGATWYTILANPYSGNDQYDAIRLRGDELADPVEKRPFGAITGYVGSYADYLTLLNSRNSQWFTIFPIPGSKTLPGEIAASVAGAVARSAQVNPERPFRTLELVGVRPASESWDYGQRDDVVVAGGSTFTSDADGVVRIEDLVTTYTTDPDTTENDAWRFFETLTNVQTKIYNLDQLFKGAPFSRCVVVDDESTTNKAHAVRPKTAKAFLIQLVDQWILNAWSRERDAIVDGIFVEIDSSNAGRLNILVPDIIAAGGKIFAVKYEWAFQAPA